VVRQKSSIPPEWLGLSEGGNSKINSMFIVMFSHRALEFMGLSIRSTAEQNLVPLAQLGRRVGEALVGQDYNTEIDGIPSGAASRDFAKMVPRKKQLKIEVRDGFIFF
jgi:hypothetical protein